MIPRKYVKEIIGLPYYHLYHRFFPQNGNRVLIYHSLGSKLSWGEYGISMDPQVFKEHMDFLAKSYTIISQEDISASLDTPTLCITLDDGYKDNLIAYEIFEELQIPFTIFVSTQFINQSYWLNQEEIKMLASSPLCTLGTHGHSHTKLGTLAPEKQQEELSTSKQILEDIIGRNIDCMSYPHGSYNQRTLEIAKNLGYKICHSSDIGLNTSNNFNPLKIKRSEIIASDTLSNLKKKIDGFYDFLSLKEWI